MQIVAQFVFQISCGALKVQALAILCDGFLGDTIVRLVRSVDILHLGMMSVSGDQREEQQTLS